MENMAKVAKSQRDLVLMPSFASPRGRHRAALQRGIPHTATATPRQSTENTSSPYSLTTTVKGIERSKHATNQTRRWQPYFVPLPPSGKLAYAGLVQLAWVSGAVRLRPAAAGLDVGNRVITLITFRPVRNESLNALLGQSEGLDEGFLFNHVPTYSSNV